MACRIPSIAWLLLAVLSSPATAQPDDLEVCRRPGINDRRIAACTRVIASTSERTLLAQAYTNRGAAWVSTGERDKAEADFNEALKLDATSAAGLTTLAQRHNLLNDPDQAIVATSAAIRLDPKHQRAFTIRGNAYFDKGDLVRAIADYEDALRLGPDVAANHYSRGRARLYRGDRDGALVDFDRTIAIDPEFVLAWLLRGQLYLQKGDSDRALADLEEAIRLEPGRAATYVERGRAHAAKNQWLAAVADTTSAIRLNPRLAMAYNNRGHYRRTLGNFETALTDFDMAIELDPEMPLFYSNRGFLHQVRNEPARALADFSRVLELPAKSAADRQRQETARERVARLGETIKAAGGAARLAEVRHKRVALVIGNSAYTQTGMLPNPVKDARSMVATLKRVGFTHVVDLYDATREQMLQGLKTWGDSVEGAEWALVFFAGHGLELNGTTYIVPIDAALRRDTHVEDETISLNRIIAKVDAASKIGLIILDSCRDNPFLKKMTRSGGATRSIGQGLAPVDPEGNVLVAYAAKPGTVAEDGTGDHSPFTAALLQHMTERGIEVQFLFRKVRETVRTATERRQEPAHYSALGAEPLYLRPPLPR